MLWLMWFGARKRSYHSRSAPLVGWLSAHIYLGLALVVLVPMNAGFQFAWNVHTLAYALILGVAASGVVGLWAYTSAPTQITELRPGQSVESLFQRVDDIDLECRNIATAMPDTIARAVARCLDETRLSLSLRTLIGSTEQACPTEGAIRQIGVDMRSLAPRLRDEAEKLLELLGAKRTVVDQIRRDQRLKALLDVWLFVHVPLAAAALVVTLVHVFVVLAHR
jgi:hypothetical protein